MANEDVKSKGDIMLQVYVKLCNVILDTGYVPDSWITGIIRPIMRKKVHNYIQISIAY